MVLMESYFFCASVRLGVLVTCIAATIKNSIFMWLIFADGTSFLYFFINILETHYRTSIIVKESVTWAEHYSKELMMFIQLYSFCHIATCFSAAYGAYKLKKYHVIPLAIFEFIYTVQVVVLVIITLRIARHIVPLATLILMTLALSFYAMLVAYDTLALIAFVQIMFLVRSQRYIRLYGPDPLNPVTNGVQSNQMASKNPITQQPIIIYVMPKAGQKLWDVPQSKWWQDEKTDVSVPQKANYEESSEFFQRQELLSKVLLRNAIKEDYLHKERVAI
ncbi:uncharacterized protein LOC6731106 [Drosophila simulans]|uniref:GD23358 n=1 Tax=Drosophila simulans TaxID=7240 RepID=B4Q415_DROSI|nr:uncharacterized protein LOC6731106 [Drosophila simulans]EDX03848.1 GD23358 [Drosophila simulans]KMY88354.1 uncharacterized protein Dsimw501_GD23358 [Drosophila simulans]